MLSLLPPNRCAPDENPMTRKFHILVGCTLCMLRAMPMDTIRELVRRNLDALLPDRVGDLPCLRPDAFADAYLFRKHALFHRYQPFFDHRDDYGLSLLPWCWRFAICQHAPNDDLLD